jgi:uncharacterized protein
VVVRTSAGNGSAWPEGVLDVDRLRREGWRPAPFRQFVLKLHGLCNLACDYCYVYKGADQSWRSRPTVMSEETVRRVTGRIAEHAEAHAPPAIEVILHGGEPLLAGTDLITLVVDSLRAAREHAQVSVTLQTNGVLLTEGVLRALRDCDVGVGVSLDGDSVAHDRHRRYANGNGSHAAVARALRMLDGPYRSLYRGLLCTVDLQNDPLRTYEALLEFAPPAVDFLLPHGNWSTPPPGRPADAPDHAPYADWLIVVFDRWYGAPRRETRVRLFAEILNVLLGGASHCESIGLSPVAMVVVDTDGTMQQVDTLKTAFSTAPETGLNVAEHPFDAALRHPAVAARQIGIAALSDTCRGCDIRRVCGGGNYPHRYRAGGGFRNPSVYCPDLFRLIHYIAGRVRRDVAELAGRRS